MRLIVDRIPADPAFGLAMEEALFESIRREGSSLARLWVNRRAIVIGRSQAVASEVDLAGAEEDGDPVLRRISGGGTVVHYPGNLNVSVMVASSSPSLSVAEAFAQLGGAIASGLRILGAKVDVRGNRLLGEGRKLGGAAQARRGDALLVHSTILVFPARRPIERNLLAHRSEYCPLGVASRAEPMTNLTEVLGRDVGIEEVAAAIADGLERELLQGESMQPSGVRESEAERALTLVQEKYGSDAWNRSR